jgi:hypothetical protein
MRGATEIERRPIGTLLGPIVSLFGQPRARPGRQNPEPDRRNADAVTRESGSAPAMPSLVGRIRGLSDQMRVRNDGMRFLAAESRGVTVAGASRHRSMPTLAIQVPTWSRPIRTLQLERWTFGRDEDSIR